MPLMTVYSFPSMAALSNTEAALLSACRKIAETAVPSAPAADTIGAGAKVAARAAANTSEFAFLKNLLSISIIPFLLLPNSYKNTCINHIIPAHGNTRDKKLLLSSDMFLRRY